VLVVVIAVRCVAVGPVQVVDVVSVLHGGVAAAVPVLVIMCSIDSVHLTAALVDVIVVRMVEVPVVQVVDVPLVLDRRMAAVGRMHVGVAFVGRVRGGRHGRLPIAYR
jgi:hypothetical protein